MNAQTRLGVLLVLMGVAVLIIFVQIASNNNTLTTEPTLTEETEPTTTPEPSLITVTAPLPHDTVGNPVVVQGEARGYWFFEASAPVIVTNWDGLIIGEGYITADGEWMTEDFVPFTGTIEYELPVDSYSASGTIIFKRDNPSDLPENDASYEVPVVLELGE